MKNLKYAFLPALISLPVSAYAQVNETELDDRVASIGTFGGIGLLEMHNARFSDDGAFIVGVGHVGGGENYYTTWQATPWLETTLRFTDKNYNYGGIDKSIDVKIRVLEEGIIRPALAIGLQDMLGDGLYSGEYIVASKTVGVFDITAGFGFGGLAKRSKVSNIARMFGDGFKTRSFTNDGSEKLRLGDYFSGEKMGFFWGLEYKTPIEGLTAKVEYSTADKSNTLGFEDYKSKTAFNFGVNYKVRNWLEVGAGLQHGNQLALHFTVKQNLHKPMRLNFAKGPEVDEIRSREMRTRAKSSEDYKTSVDPDVIFERVRQLGYSINSLNLEAGHIGIELDTLDGPLQSNLMVLGALLESYPSASLSFNDDNTNNIHASFDDSIGKMALSKYRQSSFASREKDTATLIEKDRQEISEAILAKMNAKRLEPESVRIEEQEIIITKNIAPFNDIPINIGRTARILTNEAPDKVERFTIISKDRGLDISKISLLRKDIERLATYNSSSDEILSNASIEENNIPEINGEKENVFKYGFFPEVISHFGSQKDDHFKADLNLKLFGSFDVSNELQIYAEVKQHIFGNLDMIPALQNPDVHHVRSDIGKYSREGKTSISRLTAEYIDSPTRNLYARLTAGGLEEMYSGISAEVLYSPYDSSVSFGVDVNFVKQRGYDQLFSMRDYKTVTGHVNFYHVNNKYDITTKISAGRYLAKDWGTTIDISRRFDNGIKIGAMATFTDMPQSEFGRGGFDKGIYISVPFDFFWHKQSRRNAEFNFKRLGKNGGQKLNHRSNLYDIISAGHSYRIRNSWNKIVD